jgi:hypothetical protein
MNAKGGRIQTERIRPHINADEHREVLGLSKIQLPYLLIRVHLQLIFYSCSFAFDSDLAALVHGDLITIGQTIGLISHRYYC